jgi:DNA-binding NtrC family response regulator
MSSAGYTVLTAGDGLEALEVVRGAGPIRVLVTDIVMPNMRGPELAKVLKASRKNLKVIYMSGYLEFHKADDEFLEGSFFLQKPFSRDSLVSKVDEALKQNRVAGSTARQLV